MCLEPFKRLIHGDLREMYEQLVILAPESEERDFWMGIMNVMCGNVELECAYAVLKTFNITRQTLDIYGQKGQSCHLIHNRTDLYHEKCFRPIVDVFRF